MYEIANMVLKAMQEENMIPEIINSYFNGSEDERKQELYKIAKLLDVKLTRNFVDQMAIEDKKNFIEAYNEQISKDTEILERWESQRVEATDEYIPPAKKQKTENLLNIVGQ